jgi:hypothetical protein
VHKWCLDACLICFAMQQLLEHDSWDPDNMARLPCLLCRALTWGRPSFAPEFRHRKGNYGKALLVCISLPDAGAGLQEQQQDVVDDI